MENYDSKNFKVLTSIQVIRKRPGMYTLGIHHLLWEVISNSMDLFMANLCTEISIILHPDESIEIIDNGTQKPFHGKRSGNNYLQTVMTELHSSATYDGHAPHTHVGGIHGVGLVVVNALSSYADVNMYHDGKHYQQKYINSKPQKYQEIGLTKKQGTSIRFQPDKPFFKERDYYLSTEFNYCLISQRIKELCFLNKGLIMSLQDKRCFKQSYQYNQGLVHYIENSEAMDELILSIKDEYKGIKVDVALGWSASKGHIKSFANNLDTCDGGAHVDGLKKGLKKALKLHEKDFKKELITNLVAIVHVNIADPKYGAPTKDRLINKKAYHAVKNVVYQLIVKTLNKSPKLFNNLF